MSLLRGKNNESRSISYQQVWGSGADFDDSLLPTRGTDRALQLAAVHACWRLISESIASLPVDVYEKDARGNAVEVAPAQRKFIAAPSKLFAFDEWISQAVLSVLSNGNAYGVVENRFEMLPSEIEIYSPADVAVSMGASWRPKYEVRGKPVNPNDVFHLRGLVLPGNVAGVSPLTAARRAIDLGLRAEQFGEQFFRDGAHPSSVLSTDQPITAEQAETIKARFIAAVRGRREPAVLGAGLKYSPIQVRPDESQFLETQRFTVAQIARVYGVPPEMIGGDAGGNLTYANTEQRAIDFVQYALRPWITKLERWLTSMVAPDQFVKFNVDAMIRVDLETRYRVHEIALRAGVRNADEVRALEDEPPLPNNTGQVFAPVYVPQDLEF